MVALLLVTHCDLGKSLINTLHHIVKEETPEIYFLSSEDYKDIQSLQKAILRKCVLIDQGDGVLILTDLIGASPTNAVAAISSDRVQAIAGVNLPMLLKAVNYINLSLDELVAKVTACGHISVRQIQGAK